MRKFIIFSIICVLCSSFIFAQALPSGDTLVNGELTIARGTTIIKSNQYSKNGKIKSVIIPSSVKTIGNGAFQRCLQLESVVFEDGTEHIDDSAFADCSQLKSVKLPNTLKTMGNKVFMNDQKLQMIIMPLSLTKIGTACFSNCRGLIAVRVPASLKEIPEETFRNCQSLITLVVEDGVESIGTDAFYYCKALGSIALPASIKNIAKRALDRQVTIVSLSSYAKKYAQENRNKYVEENMVFKSKSAVDKANEQKKVAEVLPPTDIAKQEKPAIEKPTVIDPSPKPKEENAPVEKVEVVKEKPAAEKTIEKPAENKPAEEKPSENKLATQVDSDDKYFHFKTTDIEGNVVTDEIFKNSKITVVNIWTVYCMYCKEELDSLVSIYPNYESSDVQFIGLLFSGMNKDGSYSQSSLTQAKEIISSKNVKYKNILLTQEIYDALRSGITGYPANIYLDSEGKILDLLTGCYPKEALIQLIARYSYIASH